jgi:hypothetical protein
VTNVCPVCLDNKLRGWLGRKIIVENDKKQVAGLFAGFRLNGRAFNVVVQEKRRFHVVENVTKLSFQDHAKEEIELIERN